MIAAFLQLPGFPLLWREKWSLSLSLTHSVYGKKKCVQVKSVWPLYHHSLACIDDSVPQDTQPTDLPPPPTALLPFLILTQPSRGKVQSQDPTLATDARTNSPRMQGLLSFPVQEKEIGSVFSFQIIFPCHTGGTPKLEPRFPPPEHPHCCTQWSITFHPSLLLLFYPCLPHPHVIKSLRSELCSILPETSHFLFSAFLLKFSKNLK